MVRNEAKKLEALAKIVHLYYDDDRQYNQSDWHDAVVEAGLGIDARTANSYFRLAKVRRLIDEPSKGRWCKGEKLERLLPRSQDRTISPDANEKEASDKS